MTPELALAILLASPALSPDILDSRGHAPPEMVRRLTEKCVRKGQVRIVAGELVYLVRIDRLDAEGMGGFKTRGSAPSPPDPLAWPLVTRMDAVHTSRSLGMVLGAITGAAIGGSLDAPVLGASVGLSIGGGLGSLRVREEPLYVAQSAPLARPPLDSAAAEPAGVALSGTATGPSEAGTGTAREPSRERIRKATGEISPGSMLRVTLATMTLAEGKVTRADDAGLHGLTPRQPQAAPAQPEVIPWARILQVEKRVGSSGRGAVYGGVSLGVLGALLGAAVVAGGGIGGGASNAGSGAAVAGGAAVSGLVCGGLGAGLGAMIGAAVPRWHVVY